MDEWKRDLSRNFSKIVKHVDNPDMIAEYLHYDCTPPVFTEADVDDIKTKCKDETTKNKTRILLNRLCYKPYYPLVALYQAFAETHNTILRECLVGSVESYFATKRNEVSITADQLPLTEPDWQTLHKSAVVTCQIHSADLVWTHKITEDNYLMTEDIRGRAVIINNSKFENKKQKTRHGSEKDVELLTKTFQQLHFNVTVYEDLSAEKIMETLEKESKNSDLKSAQCFILVMMSHGFVSGVMGLDGKEVKFDDFATCFNPTNCPALKDKPKLFFFQSCRAQGNTEGDNKDKRLTGAENNKDFLFTWACSEGSKSQRCEDTGAWFIQALCWVLKNKAHKQHLHEMLTIVNAVVSGIKENEQTCHFIPEYRGSLIKNVYFFPGVRGHPGDPSENKTVGMILRKESDVN